MEHGILRVSAHDTADITANRAKLHVRVEGETFVYGNAALSRSREVAELVSRLEGLGLSDEDVNVAGVTARVNQGTLIKGSKVVFSLRFTVRDLGKLSDYVGAIATAKHAELERLEWIFDDQDKQVVALSSRAMKKAFEKAEAMTRAVGFEVVGLRSASDSHELPTPQPLAFAAPDGFERARAAPARVDLGTEFKATQTISVTVSAEFFVAKTTSA